MVLYKEERPWGFFENLKEENSFKVKRLVINPNQKISYQSHKHRDEIWTVIKGDGIFVLNDKEKDISKYSVCYVPKLAKHRVSGGSDGLEIIEVQLGEYLEEDDIERFEDDYNRV